MQNIESYKQLITIFIIVFVIALLIYLVRYRFKKREIDYTYKGKPKLTPEMWFYSNLLDIELDRKKASYKYLKSSFETYLQKRYDYNGFFSEKNTLIALLDNKEKNERIKNFLKSTIKEIETLKQKDANEVISYVKLVKFSFNKGKTSLFFSSEIS